MNPNRLPRVLKFNTDEYEYIVTLMRIWVYLTDGSTVSLVQLDAAEKFRNTPPEIAKTKLDWKIKTRKRHNCGKESSEKGVNIHE
jgi:hypothetical protein